MIGGVVGGFAEYFSIDSTLLRFGVVAAILITGFFPGVVLYIIGLVMIPNEPEVRVREI